MSDNEIFVTGGPVRFDSPVYISRRTDEQAWLTVLRKRYLTIVAPRQMGKTSLLQKLQAAVEEYGYATALLDLSTFNREGLQWIDWAQEVCSQITNQLRAFCDEDLHVEFPKTPFEFAEFLSILSRQISASSILILLDEAASVPSDIRDPFYSVIRWIYTDRTGPRPRKSLTRYNFVFAGVFQPERLVQNRVNSPFNVSRIIRLSDFSVEETEQLLQNLIRIRPVEITDDLLEAVYTWTGGHPYLTQQLASLLGEQLELDGNIVLDDGIVERLIPELMEIARDNIDPVTKLAATSNEEAREWTRRVLAGEPILFSRAIPQHSELELIGAIKSSPDSKCQIRNRVYEIALVPVYQFEDHMQRRIPRMTDGKKEGDTTPAAPGSTQVIIQGPVGVVGAIGQGAQTTADTVAGRDVDIGIDTNEVASAFAKIYAAITAKSFASDTDAQDARETVELVEEENKKGAQANEKAVRLSLRNLARIAPDIFEVAIATFCSPIQGISTVVRKVAEKAKEEEADGVQKDSS